MGCTGVLTGHLPGLSTSTASTADRKALEVVDLCSSVEQGPRLLSLLHETLARKRHWNGDDFLEHSKISMTNTAFVLSLIVDNFAVGCTRRNRNDNTTFPVTAIQLGPFGRLVLNELTPSRCDMSEQLSLSISRNGPSLPSTLRQIRTPHIHP